MAASNVQPWLLLLLILLPAAVVSPQTAAAPPQPTPAFDENYVPSYGQDGYHLVDMGTEIRLTLDRRNGAGFVSKLKFGSGFFHMRIKVPSGYTAGVVTAFYLVSDPPSAPDHDEVDFEFLGNVDGKPIILQTNVFVNGHGDREQRLSLWFDPAADFHDYRILWNPFQIVLFVDETPVRVLRNLSGRVPEYEFPEKQMTVRGSVWDGSDWATDGGRTKVDWSRAPFMAEFRGFDVAGCANTSSTPCDSQSSPDMWWNGGEYRRLSAEQHGAYENVRNKYMNYDYCTDKGRFKNKLPAECSYA